MRFIFLCVIAFAIATPAAAGGKKGPPPVQTREVASEAILTDEEGMTLYTFDRDGRYRPNCIGECASTWRPFRAEVTGFDADWTVITRSDGISQWAYGGRPIYTFEGDKNPGEMNGAGADNGAWRVAKPLCFASPPTGKAHDAEPIIEVAIEAGVEPIRELRAHCGLGLGELVDLSGVRRVDLQAHEAGQRALSVPQVAAVANALNVPIYLLLE